MIVVYTRIVGDGGVDSSCVVLLHVNVLFRIAGYTRFVYYLHRIDKDDMYTRYYYTMRVYTAILNTTCPHLTNAHNVYTT